VIDDEPTRPDTLLAILDEARRARAAAEHTTEAVQVLGFELRDVRGTMADYGRRIGALELARTILPLVALAGSLVSLAVCSALLLVVMRMAGAG
jgi:hypothetical protein